MQTCMCTSEVGLYYLLSPLCFIKRFLLKADVQGSTATMVFSLFYMMMYVLRTFKLFLTAS